MEVYKSVGKTEIDPRYHELRLDVQIKMALAQKADREALDALASQPKSSQKVAEGQ